MPTPTPIAAAFSAAVVDADDQFRIASADANGVVPAIPHVYALNRALLVASIEAISALEREIANLRRE